MLDKHIFQNANSKTLAESQESCIISARITMSYFNLEKGACPGDPLSAYLFILCLLFYQALFLLVKANHKIRGIKIFHYT